MPSSGQIRYQSLVENTKYGSILGSTINVSQTLQYEFECFSQLCLLLRRIGDRSKLSMFQIFVRKVSKLANMMPGCSRYGYFCDDNLGIDKHAIVQSIWHSLILSREGLLLALSVLPCPEGWISWSIPVDGLMMRRISVLHQNLRWNWEIHPLRHRDFPIPPSFWWSTDVLLIINPPTEMDQEIHPCGQERIDSVEINPSPQRMREC